MTEEHNFATHDAGLLCRNRGYLAMGAAPIGVGLATVVVEGLENAPQAFMGLLEGRNFGKLVVHVGEP